MDIVKIDAIQGIALHADGSISVETPRVSLQFTPATHTQLLQALLPIPSKGARIPIRVLRAERVEFLSAPAGDCRIRCHLMQGCAMNIALPAAMARSLQKAIGRFLKEQPEPH